MLTTDIVLGYYRNLGSLRYGNEYLRRDIDVSMGKSLFSSSLKPFSIMQL